MSSNSPKPPFASYQGSGSYAFICYAHHDAEEVYSDLAWLKSQGLNIWFDEGVSPGRQWRDELADAIDNCSLFIAFLSPEAVISPHCQKEINYAIQQGKRFLAIHLSETKLTSGLALAMGDLQALMKYRFDSETFRTKILRVVTEISTSSGPVVNEGVATQDRQKPSLRRIFTPRFYNRLGWIAVSGLVIAAAIIYFLVSGAPKAQTIAVLAFDNFTGDASNDYISDGIAEEVIDLLQKVSGLKVVGRKASFYFKGKDVEFTTIAKRLRADVVLEGSLRRDKNKLRVAAQLINGKTGLHEWSAMFDQDVGDLITLQRQLAMQMATALEASLGENDIAAIKQAPTEDNEAYALYLEGRHYLRIAATIADLETARNLFSRALQRDPHFIRAQSGLCDSELSYYQRTRTQTDYARASAVCAQLTAGRKPDPEALVALGTLNRLVGNYSASLDLFDAAIAGNPRLEPAHYGRARALQGLGRLTQAEESLKQSIALQPGYWQTYSGYGVFLAMTGRLSEAVLQFRRVIDLTPENPQGYGNLGTALFALGEWQDAEAAWDKSLELEESVHGYINVGTALYYQHKYADAARLFQQGAEKFPQTFRLWGKLGSALIALGQTEQAQAAFERAIELAEPLLEVNPADTYALGYLCVYRTRIGQAERGLPLCDKAVVAAPEDPDIHYLWATALQLAGRKNESQIALQKALELGYSKKWLTVDPVFADLSQRELLRP